VRAELLISSLFVCAGAGLLLVEVTAWTVIPFMIVFSFFNPLTVNSLTTYYYRRMDFLPLRGHFRIEAIVLREFFLNAGRVLSILFLIVSVDNPASSSLPIVLAIASLLQFGMIALVERRISSAEAQIPRKHAKSPGL
jgi:YQGE family putative transporter